MDFGLALSRDAYRLTGAHRMIGAVAYMAPEQARGEDASPASDCFALAVVLHEASSGVHPILATTGCLAVGRVAVSISGLDATGAGVGVILKRALSPAAADRYPEAQALLDDLERTRRDAFGDASEIHAAPRSRRTPDDQPTVELEPLVAPPEFAQGAWFGRYEIDREIGRGGQGGIYRARDSVLDRTITLKLLLSPHRSDPLLLELFRNEARAAARLDPPNVIVIFDYGAGVRSSAAGE